MAQKLDPKHKEMYERVMNTPTKKPSPSQSNAPSSASSAKPEPKPATPPPPPAQKSAFLSSMPIQPSKSLGIKTFTFSGGKKKVNKEEHKEEKTKQTPHEDHAQKPQGEKKKVSRKIIVLSIFGFVIIWGLFWAYILGFI